MGQVQIHVVKGVPAFVGLIIFRHDELQNRPGNGIQPTVPQGDVKGSLAFYNGSAVLHLCIDQTDRERSGIIIEASLFRGHVNNGRSPSAESCRETALIEIQAFNSISIER